MKILISGSVVYDNIMGFSGNFSDEIMPDKVHILNVSFPVPVLRQEFGGCCGNIVYNLKLLGSDPIALASVGKDFGRYQDHMQSIGINTDYLEKYQEHNTAQAFIITDKNNNQITAFHPGAMNFADRLSIPNEKFDLACVSPNSKNAMLKHSRELAKMNIPYLFDPGQAIGLFSGVELQEMIELATYLAVNDYESEQIAQITGWSIQEIANKLDGLIVTKGGKGSQLFENGKIHEIPVAKVDKIVDPTGCGDSYRAGFLHVLSKGGTLIEACELGAKMGAIKIGVEGGQNHGDMVLKMKGKNLKL